MNPAAEVRLNRASSEFLGNGYNTCSCKKDPIRQILDGALKNHEHVSQRDVLYECGDHYRGPFASAQRS